jgi:polysaccharide export outer membrane protein
LALLLCGCGSVGTFVWVDDYAPAVRDQQQGYRITAGDLLAITVYGQDGVSAKERVRADGMISLPLLRDVPAAGTTPNELAEQIQAAYRAYINKPVVTVAVEEATRLSVPVLGEVARPGQYSLDHGAGILEALAAAGGFNDLAHRDRIFVLRRRPSVARIRFTYDALSRGSGRAVAFRLEPGDSVIVE